jgi:hypothetical protein
MIRKSSSCQGIKHRRGFSFQYKTFLSSEANSKMEPREIGKRDWK